jgi:hypothetical protein
MSTIRPEILAKLRTFDTPTVCNLIELFEVRPRNTGYMDARIRACFPEMAPIRRAWARPSSCFRTWTIQQLRRRLER